jgi:hypothetical protein
VTTTVPCLPEELTVLKQLALAALIVAASAGADPAAAEIIETTVEVPVEVSDT